MTQLSQAEAIDLRRCLETIIAEAEELGEIGATIVEQAEDAKAIIEREMQREFDGREQAPKDIISPDNGHRTLRRGQPMGDGDRQP